MPTLKPKDNTIEGTKVTALSNTMIYFSKKKWKVHCFIFQKKMQKLCDQFSIYHKRVKLPTVNYTQITHRLFL